MNTKYMFWCENVRDIPEIFAPALLWKDDINNITFGLMLINKTHYSQMIKYVNKKRTSIKVQKINSEEVREFEKIEHITEDNTSLLTDEVIRKKFMVDDKIWAEGFIICRLCLNIINRMKFACSFGESTCAPNWKI